MGRNRRYIKLLVISTALILSVIKGMTQLIPKKVFLTAGIGKHPTKLGSFERALRDAKIHAYNLVPVSSIIPPDAKIISKEEGIKYLVPGQILFVVLSRISSNAVGRRVVAAIGVAKDRDSSLHGYISEYSAYDIDPEQARKSAEYLATEMLATIKGENSWDIKSEMPKFDNFDIRSIVTSAVVESEKEWVTAIAAAVLII
ncbi:MAG: pyruvoyl-dependent arginine decarboxylase [Candidatus Asgardarchaeia archaeon]